MSYTRDRIKESCTTAVFDQGVDYHEDDRVSGLGRYGATVSATVRGSQSTPYTIEIELANETDKLHASCSCPYEGQGYCKHIVATWLAAVEQEPEDDQQTVERRLERADSDELREFLREVFTDKPNLRRRFLTNTNDQPVDQTLADYKFELANRYPVEDRKPPMTGPPQEFSEFERRAERLKKRGQPLEAVLIYRAMVEVRAEETDFVPEYHEDAVYDELEAFSECLDMADPPHEDKRDHIEFLFEKWRSEDRFYRYFRDTFGRILRSVCTSEADIRHYATLLEEFLPDDLLAGEGDLSDFGISIPFKEYLDCLEDLGEYERVRELYEQYYEENSTFYAPYVTFLRTTGDESRAIEVAEEGQEAYDNVRLRHHLVELYKGRSSERYEHHVARRFIETRDWSCYETLKERSSPEEWNERVIQFEDELTTEEKIHMLIELYQREDRLDEAFDLVIERAQANETTRSIGSYNKRGLPILRKYREELGDYDPETYYETYEELLEPYAAKKTGRGHYQTIVDHLEELEELDFDDRFEAFVDHLRETHSNRPAFLDEMDKAGFQ